MRARSVNRPKVLPRRTLVDAAQLWAGLSVGNRRWTTPLRVLRAAVAKACRPDRRRQGEHRGSLGCGRGAGLHRVPRSIGGRRRTCEPSPRTPPDRAHDPSAASTSRPFLPRAWQAGASGSTRGRSRSGLRQAQGDKWGRKSAVCRREWGASGVEQLLSRGHRARSDRYEAARVCAPRGDRWGECDSERACSTIRSTSCDGSVVALEVKLAATVDDRDVRHLLWLRDRIGDQLLNAAVPTTVSTPTGVLMP